MRAAGEAPLDLIELLGALSTERPASNRRGEAMACFLSGGQGWREAAASLGGTFAKRMEKPVRLTGGKEE